MRRKRVAVLISGRGSNMMALVEGAKEKDYPAEIALVLSNRPEAEGLKAAEGASIKTALVDHTAFGPDREAFDRAIQAELFENRIDIVCLGGFMRLLTPWFVRQWEGNILNIHPALLPAFKGLDTHRRALAAGMKAHGASVHYVVAELDSGPVIAQGVVPVLSDDTPETLGERVLAMEHRLYPMVLKLLAGGKVRVINGKVQIDDN